MAYPKRLLSEGEHVQKEFRPHLLAIIKPILLVVGAFAVAVSGSAILDGGWLTTALVVAGLMVLAGIPGFTKWWFQGMSSPMSDLLPGRAYSAERGKRSR